MPKSTQVVDRLKLLVLQAFVTLNLLLKLKIKRLDWVCDTLDFARCQARYSQLRALFGKPDFFSCQSQFRLRVFALGSNHVRSPFICKGGIRNMMNFLMLTY